jgi:hypothetical protein
VRRLGGGTAIRRRGGEWLRLAVAVGPGLTEWSPGRKGGRSGRDASTQGLDPRGTAAHVPAGFKTMALSFGADRLLDTVLRPEFVGLGSPDS